MLYKYRVYCETESVHVITDFQASPPTACPNDAAHTLREYDDNEGPDPLPVIVDEQ